MKALMDARPGLPGWVAIRFRPAAAGIPLPD